MKGTVSERQLAAAAFTGLLAPAAAVAGLDWRGALAAVPVVMTAAWCWSERAETTGEKGRSLSLLYIMWEVPYAGAVLAAAAERITAPEGRGTEWVLLLLLLPVLWLTVERPAVFGRAAEIFYLAMLAVLVFVLLLGGLQIKLGRLLEEAEGFWMSWLAAAGTGCGAVAAVLLREREGGPTKGIWIRWSGASAVVLLLMSMVTTGVLSPALAAEQELPFFTVTVGLGRTARVEGLVSAVWLLSEVTLAALLLQSGRRLWRGCRPTVKHKEKARALVLTAAVGGVALWILQKESSGIWLRVLLPVPGLILGGAAPMMGRLCTKWRKPKKRDAHLGEKEG